MRGDQVGPGHVRLRGKLHRHDGDLMPVSIRYYTRLNDPALEELATTLAGTYIFGETRGQRLASLVRGVSIAVNQRDHPISRLCPTAVADARCLITCQRL